MTFKEMLDYITAAVQDSSFTEEQIRSKINGAVKKVAQGMMIPGRHEISPPLPVLYASATVQTVSNQNVVALPDDYCRGLKQAVSEELPLAISDSLPVFRGRYPVMEPGGVRCVCVAGRKLFYAHVPETPATIAINYYRVPDLLVQDNDLPDCIPDVLHEELICGEVCRQIYAFIEDGMEGRKANTEYYTGVVSKAIGEIELHVGIDQGGMNYGDGCSEEYIP